MSRDLEMDCRFDIIRGWGEVSIWIFHLPSGKSVHGVGANESALKAELTEALRRKVEEGVGQK